MGRRWVSFWLGVFAVLCGAGAQANPIVPANDGVGTVVNRVGNQFDITGGTRAGANLFHSLLKFGLSEQQIANFLSQPSIRNILTRVTGGETSVINGLIKVTGGNSNLYLMNPAGIIFGSNASLNVPAAFHATTANAIKIGNSYFGMNTTAAELATLISDPIGFAFSSLNQNLNPASPAGVIVNQGTLSINPGQTIVLAGNQVINTGTIQTPNGTIIITATADGKFVNVSQSGSILSLDLPVAVNQNIAVQNLRPVLPNDIPQLLTGTAYVGGTVSTASEVRNPNSMINLTGERVILDRANLSNVGTDGLIQIRVAPGIANEGYVFLDRVRNYEQLVNALAPGSEAYLINPTDSGVEKVNQVLAKRGGVQRLDIVGDGNAGQIWFGKDFITLDTLPQYEAQLAQWGQGLTGSREIFLYACNLAASQAGIELVNKIGELTNSTVSASTDITGHGKYGGNWQFEYSTGSISGQNVFTAETIQNADVKLVTFTVTDLGDTGAPNQLRDAINQANITPGLDDIKFALNGTITLQLGELVVNDLAGLIINGNGIANTIIDGNNASRVFNVTAGDITFNDLTIRNGKTAGNGGGIFATGSVTLTNSKVSGNTADVNGGGISANKNVTLNNSQVLNNEATNGSGGGIFASGDVTLNNASLVSENNRAKLSGGGIFAFGNVILNDSEVSVNTAGQNGGGILSFNGNITLTNSTVAQNSAAQSGGGIFANDPNSTVTLKNNSVVFGNQALNGSGGGILAFGAVNVTDSNVSNNTADLNGGGIHASGNVDLKNSTMFTNNALNGNGGGIWTAVNTNLTIDDSTIFNNKAGQDGGGILASGNVILNNNSVVSDNKAGQDGGGIYTDGTVTLTNSKVLGNTAGQDGGGIYVGGGGQISNSVITGNDAQTGSGGGIFNGGGSDLTISASKITGNEASVSGAGIANDGTLTLKDVTVAGNGENSVQNNGGGLANGSGATATIENSTFSGNFANNGGGGGIDNQGTLTMTNSTIGNNEAALEGGGIKNLGGDVTLKNVTIVGNQVTLAGGQGGGGIVNAPASTVTISNSIVAGNEDLANGVTKNEVVNQGTFTISGKNLVGQNGNLGGFPADPSNIVVPGGVIGVQVAPLANNGGFTETFALLPGSLAINASGAGATTSDQRGVAAVGIRDIGAFESGFSLDINDGSPETTSDGGFQPKLQVDGEGDILLLLKELKVLAVEPPLSPLETLTSWDQSFALQFGLSGLEPENAIGSIQEMQEVLKQAEEQGRGRTALVYWWMRDGNLTLGLFLPKGIAQQTVFVKTVNVNQKEIDQTITDFVSAIKDFRQRDTFNYRPAAQKLYSWLLAPIEPILENYQIETLMLVPDEKFRAIPYRALWNGNQYLIERYRITQIPSIKLVNLDLTSQSLTRNLIAMGASEFNGRKPNLPAVPVELQQVAEINQGQMRLNQEFTVETVINTWRTAPVRAVHLATHAEFSPTKHYIEFWDGAVSFQALRQLLPTARSELVVLSACRTAIGDAYAELGFAGLAVRLGAKRAVASLWYVEDEATLALMNDFYRRIQTNASIPIQSEALRQAQINMIQGKLNFRDRQLIGPGYSIPLPPTLRQDNRSFAHPYFWAGFNMIGNPW